MKEYKSLLIKNTTYKDNTPLGKFFLYNIIYPIVNRIGLNRNFNLLRHRLGFYAENQNQTCQWCGENHRKVPLSEYREEKSVTN